MEPTITWRAPEFEYYDKDVSWYWLSIILTVFLLAFALWQKNFLFAIFLLIAEALVIRWGQTWPQIIEFEANASGIAVSDIKFFNYKDLDYFSVFEKGGEIEEIILKKKGRLGHGLRIPVPAYQIGEVREFLLVYLPEEEHNEHFSDTLGRLIGF